MSGLLLSSHFEQRLREQHTETVVLSFLLAVSSESTDPVREFEQEIVGTAFKAKIKVQIKTLFPSEGKGQDNDDDDDDDDDDDSANYGPGSV